MLTMSYSRKRPISFVGRNELQGYGFDLGHVNFDCFTPSIKHKSLIGSECRLALEISFADQKFTDPVMSRYFRIFLRDLTLARWNATPD